MTRLIDLDELKDWSEIVPLTFDGGIDIDVFEEKLKSMPTIEAEPVRYGEWILWDGKYDSGYCICSRCNRPTGVVDAFQTYKYCPFCGAKMQARCKLDAS